MVTRTRKKMTLNHFFTSILQTLPKGVLSIEDIIIRGNRIIVRYKTEHGRIVQNMSLMNNCQVVTVNSFNTLRFGDGQVMEHQDDIYQIKNI